MLTSRDHEGVTGISKKQGEIIERGQKVFFVVYQDRIYSRKFRDACGEKQESVS